jgi:hypothetical protein
MPLYRYGLSSNQTFFALFQHQSRSMSDLLERIMHGESAPVSGNETKAIGLAAVSLWA